MNIEEITRTAQVITVKLSTGETILGKQVDYTDDVLFILDPIRITPSLTTDPNTGMTLPISTPSLFWQFSENRIVQIPTFAILFASNCSEYYTTYYEAIIGDLYSIEMSRQKTFLQAISEINFTESTEGNTIAINGNKTLH